MRVLVVDLVTMAIGMLALVLHMVGMVYPGWWVVDVDKGGETGKRFFYGIWITVTCINKTEHCQSGLAELSGDKAWLMGPLVLTTLSAVCLLLVSVVNLLYILKPSYGALPRKFCVMLSLGAGSVIALAIIIFVKKKAGLRPSTARDTNHGDVGWPIILSSTACAVALVNGLLTALCVSHNFKGSNRDQTENMGKEKDLVISDGISMIPLPETKKSVDMHTRI